MTGEEFWGKAMFAGLIVAIPAYLIGDAWLSLACWVPFIVYALKYW